MLTYRCLIGLALLGSGLSVASGQQQSSFVPNNQFTAAGFVVKYATTPEKTAVLRSLPPDKLVKRTRDGTLYYVYADAAGCNCAYVGTAEAYAAYQNWANIGNSGSVSMTMATIEGDNNADLSPAMDSILNPSF